MPVGAEARPGGGVHFRVWAPRHRAVAVAFADGAAEDFPLTPEGNGYHAGTARAAKVGTRYRFRLGGSDDHGRGKGQSKDKDAGEDECTLAADPAARFQPEGPHGPSEVIDPSTYRWADHDWRGPAVEGQVIYPRISCMAIAHLGRPCSDCPLRWKSRWT